jgi:G3E family GTPase
MDDMMHRLRVVETTYCDVPWDVLLSTDTSAMRMIETPVEAVPVPDHAVDFDRWTYESTEPLSLAALKRMVRLELPGSVFRLKGFVYTSDDPEHRYVVHTVGRRSEVRRHDPWADRPPATRLVAIAAADQLDQQWLRVAIDRCIPGNDLARS